MSEAASFYSAGKKLEEFGYPNSLREVVLRFAQLVQDYFIGLDSGVLLIGSAARGELSWVMEQNRIELFSDIEFLVGVNNKNLQIEGRFEKAVSELESDHDFGSLFHIDYTVIPWIKLRRLDKRFLVFESRCCGIDLGNRSVRSELPAVNRSNLNWKELNEVLLHRMNSMLYSLPLALLTHQEASMRTFALALAKNTLDVTTWLHPYESAKLIAGFERRLEDWEQSLPNRLLGTYLSENEIRHLWLCLGLRKEPSKQVDMRTMLGNSILIYQRAISYCKAMNGIATQVSISDVSASMNLFDEYRFRGRLRNAFSIFKNFRSFGLVMASKNMVAPRKGIQANFGFYMLSAVSQYLGHDGECWNSLAVAKSELNRLLPDIDGALEGFVVSWDNARARYKEFDRAIG